jgi:hypothetical protein
VRKKAAEVSPAPDPVSTPLPPFTPLYAAPTWSAEHLLLHECSGHPRELAEILRAARERHKDVLTLQGRLHLTDSMKATWGRIVTDGYVRRQGTGCVLTRQGEQRLYYLYSTQAIDPYLKRVAQSHGVAAARQLRLELA